MWIKRSDYDAMLGRAIDATGAKEVLERQLIAQKVTLDWALVRVTQLEHERAQLLYRYMDVKITVPEFDTSTEVKRPAAGSELLADLPSFTDVGDEEAKKQGLDWDSEGRVTQHGKAIS